MARKRIGELLLERGAITPAQLEEGLVHHRQSRQRLGLALIQKGFISEGMLAKVLADALGFPVVDPTAEQADWSAIHMLRARFCETHDLFPYGLEQGEKGRKRLKVALSDPLNLPAIEEIEFTTGLKVAPAVATLSGIRGAIRRYYHKQGLAAPAGRMEVVQQGGQTLSVLDDPEGPVSAGDTSSEAPSDEGEEVIEGELLEVPENAPEGAKSRPPRQMTGRTALAELMRERENATKSKRRTTASGDPIDALSRDLDYLFGVREEPDPVERLERRFWALMRLMARKGLITKEEFSDELDE